MGVDQEYFLEVMRARARQETEWIEHRFPGASSAAEEVEACTQFRAAASMARHTFGRTSYEFLISLDGGVARAMLRELSPDWEAVTFAAKLIRYITLCARLEMRMFTPAQRLARDEREKRHEEILARWPVVGF